MYLYLLEFTYAVEDREAVESWLGKAGLSGVLISVQQYDDEMFAVLADKQSVPEDQKKLGVHAAISSSQAKRRALYRITTKSAPRSVLRSFPLEDDDEWYAGDERMMYLSLPSHKFGHKQIAWLAMCPDIVLWEDTFPLTPLPLASCNLAGQAE
jgi:hypothetical protein